MTRSAAEPDVRVDQLGANLKRLRLSVGKSQHGLSKEAGIASCLVRSIEVGRGPNATWLTVCKLADALGVDVGEFRKPIEEKSR